MSKNALPKMQYVRLGQSGLKVCLSASLNSHTDVQISKVVLGCMSYGSKDRIPWVLEEEDSIKQLKVNRRHEHLTAVCLRCRHQHF